MRRIAALTAALAITTTACPREVDHTTAGASVVHAGYPATDTNARSVARWETEADYLVATTVRASRGRTATTATTVRRPATRAEVAYGDLLDRIARCESGGRANAVSPTGKYRGAFQFDMATWNANAPAELQGVDPASLPYDVQKQVAATLLARRGIQPWPVCGRRAS